MPLEQLVLEDIVDEFGRRVVIALYLVADDIDLVFHLVLRVLAAEDDIRQQIDGTWKMGFLNGGIEGGVFLVGESVQVATDTLQTVKYLDGRTASGPLETHVFAKVGHALFACQFVT